MASNEIVTAKPAPPLRALVRTYVGYRYEGYGAGVHRGLPGSALTLVVPIGAPISLGWPGTAAEDFDSVVGGLHAGPVHIHHDGSQFGVQLDLEPLGARVLFGLPAGALTSVCVPLGELLGPVGRDLIARLQPDEAADWATRFAHLDATLLAAAARHEDDRRFVADEVTWAWRRLRRTAGAVGVGELAGEVGWSRRHLTERFRSEIGLPPKTVARLLRFERARWRVQDPAGPGLATIAAETGYYDQAHLTREFKDLAGVSPTRWLAEEELFA